MGGRVIEDYFDIGQSRSVTWERRTHGSRLLAALKDPHRGWTGVVVGEGRGAVSATSSRWSCRSSPRTAWTCGCLSWAGSSIRATPRTRC